MARSFGRSCEKQAETEGVGLMFTFNDEYRAFEALLETNIPALKVKTVASKEPADFETIFSLADSSSEEMNRAVVSRMRSYQLLFYVPDTFEALELFSKVENLLTETKSIPCKDRFIDINDFTMSRVFTTDSGKHAFFLIVEGEFNVMRKFTEAPKMQRISADIK